MANKMVIIRRGRMIYVISGDSVVVGAGGGQWISYNPYMNWNGRGLTQFRTTIQKSKENEYCTAADQMSLASECGIIGTGTRRPEGVE